LGNASRKPGQWEQAAAAFTAATKAEPKNAKTWNELGYVKFEQKERKAAQQAWENAVAQDPNLAEAHYGLGLAHLQAKQWDLVQADAERLKALDRDLAADLLDELEAKRPREK
jgi:tetratricopeptide (TPR) repeat protein